MVYEQEYTISIYDDSTDNFTNVVSDGTPIRLNAPGFFKAKAELTDGRSASVKFSNPVGEIRSNENFNLKISENSIDLNRRTA